MSLLTYCIIKLKKVYVIRPPNSRSADGNNIRAVFLAGQIPQQTRDAGPLPSDSRAEYRPIATVTRRRATPDSPQ